MINSKLEKVLIVLVWYVFLITFRLVLPIEEPPGNVDKYIIIFLSVITTLAVYHVYAYYRNRHVLNKINILLENNELDKAEEYINKCSLKQKKCRAVYMYKLYTIAMCGHIGEFEEELSKCKQLKKYKNLLDWDFIKGLKSIIGYFKTCDSTVVLSGNGYWGEIMNVLSLQNKEENAVVLSNLCNCAKSGLIKSVFAFKLYLTYSENGDLEKSESYYNAALKYAPSSEVACCIENSKSSIK